MSKLKVMNNMKNDNSIPREVISCKGTIHTETLERDKYQDYEAYLKERLIMDIGIAYAERYAQLEERWVYEDRHGNLIYSAIELDPSKFVRLSHKELIYTIKP